MSYVAYGYGKSNTNISASVAYGFGILRLFPEAIITVFNNIVYKEIRQLIIPAESRSLSVEAINRSDIINESRSVKIMSAPRTIIESASIRQDKIASISRVSQIQDILPLEIYNEIRIAVVPAENRTISIKYVDRSN